jgi:hypothetical protein
MQPHRIKVGAGVILLSVDGLAMDWGIPEDEVVRFLDFLEIPRMRFPSGEKRYVSLYPLETALFELGLPAAFKGDHVTVRTHQELAGVLYGTLSREVIVERVKALAKALSKGLTTPRKSAKIGKRKTRRRQGG